MLEKTYNSNRTQKVRVGGRYWKLGLNKLSDNITREMLKSKETDPKPVRVISG